jgi:hypothetical protein
MRFPQREIVSFVSAQAKSVGVEVRNGKSDGAEAVREARDDGEWNDTTLQLKEGDAPIGLRIGNDRGGWAGHVTVRLHVERAFGRAEILP